MQPTIVDSCEACPFYHTLDESCWFFFAAGLDKRRIENPKVIPEFCPLEDTEVEFENNIQSQGYNMTEKQIKWLSVLMASPAGVLLIVTNILLVRWGLAWWQILLIFFLFLVSGIWGAAVITAEIEALKENGYEQK